MDDLIGLAAVFFIFGVPVMSLAARFVVRPMIRDVTEAIQGKREEERGGTLGERLERIEERLRSHERRIERLAEAELFRRQLEVDRAASGGRPESMRRPSLLGSREGASREPAELT